MRGSQSGRHRQARLAPSPGPFVAYTWGMSETCPITTVRVNWTDPEIGEPRVTESTGGVGSAKYSAVLHVDGIGCTSEAQARRLARWKLAHGPQVEVEA